MLGVEMMRETRAKKTPRWVRETPAAIIKRGNELWWSNGTVTVRGTPPAGTPLADTIVEQAADWGPSGNPTQIRPHVRHENGSIAFVGQDGFEPRISLRAREVKFLSDWSDCPLAYFVYPDVEDQRQVVAVFERVPVMPEMSMEEMLRALSGGEEPPRPHFEVRLFAFVSPLVFNEEYWVDPLEKASIDRMGGHEPLQEA